jgi:hypothetical protein
MCFRGSYPQPPNYPQNTPVGVTEWIYPHTPNPLYIWGWGKWGVIRCKGVSSQDELPPTKGRAK